MEFRKAGLNPLELHATLGDKQIGIRVAAIPQKKGAKVQTAGGRA